MSSIFGEPREDAEHRRSIGAIIFNPEKTKVLALDWHIPVHGIVQGGQDEGETDIETLEREIVEETGYTDYEIKEKLGDSITSYFFAQNKDVWRESELHCYLVFLNSLDQAKQSLENDEAFVLTWIDIDEFIDMAMSHESTIYQNFKSIGTFLQRAKEAVKSYK